MSVPIADLYMLKPRSIWIAFKRDNFAFWMSCFYLFFEYVRPQAIWSGFDVYPYWARTFIFLAFLGWLLDPNHQFVWTRITTGIFAFLILIILSSFSAYWPDVSWAFFMDYFNWVVVFFVLTQIVTTRRRFFILLLIFLIASFKLSLYGARTWAMRGFAFTDWGLAGPEGYFNNAGELAIQMVVFAPIAFFFTIGIKACLRRWQVHLMYLMPITAAMTVLGSNTRGGQLALAAQVIASIAMTKHRLKTLIAIAVIGFIGFQLLPPEQKARFESSGDDETSIQRLLYWEHGWQMIKDHPLLGVGYFNFAPYYTLNYSEDLIRGEKEAQLPHNIFIQVGTDTGFLGLAVFFLLITASYVWTRKIGKAAELYDDYFVSNMSKGMNLSLLGYIVGGQFVTITYYPFLWIHFMFVTTMYTFWRVEEKSDQRMGVMDL